MPGHLRLQLFDGHDGVTETEDPDRDVDGTLEAVANPLVATLYPKNRAHFLNILHASWPAGMVLGGFGVQIFGEGMKWGWKGQLALFLVPTLIYGIMFLGQHFPKSEASQKGLKLGEMLKDVGVIGAAVIGLFIGLFLFLTLRSMESRQWRGRR